MQRPRRPATGATGVPASVTLAQAILETGWGKGALAREDHNLFGMKCFGSPGEHAIGCRDYATFECSPTGGCFDMKATFRAYTNVDDSYRDHGDLLANWSRYAVAMDHAGDPRRFAKEIHKAGYATDPKYSEKLIGHHGRLQPLPLRLKRPPDRTPAIERGPEIRLGPAFVPVKGELKVTSPWEPAVRGGVASRGGPRSKHPRTTGLPELSDPKVRFPPWRTSSVFQMHS